MYIGEVSLRHDLPITKTDDGNTSTRIHPYFEGYYVDWSTGTYEITYKLVIQRMETGQTITSIYTWKQVEKLSNEFRMEKKAYQSRLALDANLPELVVIGSESEGMIRALESAMDKLLKEYGTRPA